MNPIIIAGAVAIAGFVAVSSKGKGAAQAQADVIINGHGGAGLGTFESDRSLIPFKPPSIDAYPTQSSVDEVTLPGLDIMPSFVELTPEQEDRLLYKQAIDQILAATGVNLGNSVPYSASWKVDIMVEAARRDAITASKLVAEQREIADRQAHKNAVAQTGVAVPYGPNWQAALKELQQEGAEAKAWKAAVAQYGLNVPFGPNWRIELEDAIAASLDMDAWTAALAEHGVAVPYGPNWRDALTAAINAAAARMEKERLAEIARLQKIAEDKAALARAAADRKRIEDAKALVDRIARERAAAAAAAAAAIPVYVAPSYGMGIDDDYVAPVYVAPVYVAPSIFDIADDDADDYFYSPPVFSQPPGVGVRSQEPVLIDAFSGGLGDDDYGAGQYVDPYEAPVTTYTPPSYDAFSVMGDDDYVGFDAPPYEPPSWRDDG